MAKDKRAKKVSLNSLIHENQVEGSPERSEDTVGIDKFDSEYNDKLIAYNEKVAELDPKYSSLKFRNQILVRVFVRPMVKDDNGVLLPNRAPVYAQTQSGLGVIGEMENPYPYENKAVLVCVPDKPGYEDLKQGEIVYLKDNPVRAISVGKGDRAEIRIPNSFIHPDDRSKYMTAAAEDPSDPNYGYVKVDNYEIEIIL